MLRQTLFIFIIARLFDYFDSGVMERLRHQLINSRVNQTKLDLSLITNGLTVHSQVKFIT